MTPRPAATVMLLRDGGGNANTDGGSTGGGGLELLMVRRTPAARFMGGHWVFPGGALDPADGSGQPGLMAAAIRELREEAGVALPPDTELVAFSRWITPPELSIRFDTWSYLALAPPDASPQVDGSEIVDFRWLAPVQALTQFEAGELVLAFPTRAQLEQLSTFESAEELLAHTRGRAIEPTKPHVVGTGEHARIVLSADGGQH